MKIELTKDGLLQIETMKSIYVIGFNTVRFIGLMIICVATELLAAASLVALYVNALELITNIYFILFVIGSVLASLDISKEVKHTN